MQENRETGSHTLTTALLPDTDPPHPSLQSHCQTLANLINRFKTPLRLKPHFSMLTFLWLSQFSPVRLIFSQFNVYTDTQHFSDTLNSTLAIANSTSETQIPHSLSAWLKKNNIDIDGLTGENPFNNPGIAEDMAYAETGTWLLWYFAIITSLIWFLDKLTSFTLSFCNNPEVPAPQRDQEKKTGGLLKLLQHTLIIVNASICTFNQKRLYEAAITRTATNLPAACSAESSNFFNLFSSWSTDDCPPLYRSLMTTQFSIIYLPVVTTTITWMVLFPGSAPPWRTAIGMWGYHEI